MRQPPDDATMPAPDHPPASPIEGLSASIICKNNVTTIGRTLASIAPLASEIVAVDSGSTDGTIELLEEFGARVIRSDWLGHTATKQKALQACTRAWVLSVDSDESVEADLASSIRAALAIASPGVAGYRVNRKVWYRGRFLEHAWQPEWRTRLVRRALVPDAARWGGRDPHDQLQIDAAAGRVERLAGTLRHDTIESLAAFLHAQVRLSQIAAQSLVQTGSRGSRWRLITSPPGAFIKQLVFKGAWRDGWRGWVASGCAAASTLMKHALVLDQAQTDSDADPPRQA